MRQTLRKYQLGSYWVDFILINILNSEYWKLNFSFSPKRHVQHIDPSIFDWWQLPQQRERESQNTLFFPLICQEIQHILPSNWSKIHLLLPPPWLVLVQATIIFHLNYCNILIANSPCSWPCSSTAKQSSRLLTSNSNYITPQREVPLGGPISLRVSFVVYKALSDLTPLPLWLISYHSSSPSFHFGHDTSLLFST